MIEGLPVFAVGVPVKNKQFSLQRMTQEELRKAREKAEHFLNEKFRDCWLVR